MRSTGRVSAPILCLASAAWTVLHIRLPGGLKVKSVNPESKAAVLPDGSGIRWTAPRGTLRFQAAIGT